MFECGRVPIDRWYKNHSKKCVARLEYRVFEAIEIECNKVIGYYALQLGSESLKAIEYKPNDYTKNYVAFPSVRLAYLGVHSEYQRRGVGTALLSDVFDRVAQISDHAGFYALTLQSLDTASTKFYTSLGFTRYAGPDESPKMLIALRTIRDLVYGPDQNSQAEP